MCLNVTRIMSQCNLKAKIRFEILGQNVAMFL